MISVLIGMAVLGYALARSGPVGSTAFARGEFVTYAQFGTTADTVFEVSASSPSNRRKLLDISHAREFGIVPALSPDGARFAYTALPPGTVAPAADSPADIWVADLAPGARPRRIGQGFDLLVRPLWTPDGAGLILRRSSGSSGSFELARLDIASSAVVSVVKADAALFPIGFEAGGRSMLYASVSNAGSDVYRLDIAAGAANLVSHLSDDLSRDWTLSPDGNSLAFVSLTQSARKASSRVQVLDVATGQVSSQASDADEFGPSWSPDGKISFGRLTPSSSTTGIVAGESQLASPSRGFDMPLGWSASGSAVAVRSFDGTSLTAPGRATLALVDRQGNRKTVATGEVTFIGWTRR